MSNQEKEITIGQLFGVVKKSIKRGLIYVIVSILIASSVLLTVKMFTNKSIYSTTISFTEVNENMLPSLNSNKANVINKALTKNNKNIEDSVAILKNLSVSALQVDKIEDDEDYIPTSYVITLKKSKDMKLTSSEYKEILDFIASEYVNTFAENIVSNLHFNYDENSSFESVYLVYNYSSILTEIVNELDEMITADTDIASVKPTENGIDIETLVNKLNISLTTLENLKREIVLGKVESQSGYVTSFITSAISEQTGKIAQYDALLTAVTTAMTNYNANCAKITQNDNGNNTYIFDDSVYNELIKLNNKYAKAKAEAEQKKTILEAYKTDIGSITVNAESINNALKDELKNVKSNIESYNTFAKEYNNNKTSISTAKQINPAHANSDGIISMKLLIVAVIAIALIAYVVAFAQTFGNLKETGYFD